MVQLQPRCPLHRVWLCIGGQSGAEGFAHVDEMQWSHESAVYGTRACVTHACLLLLQILMLRSRVVCGMLADLGAQVRRAVISVCSCLQAIFLFLPLSRALLPALQPLHATVAGTSRPACSPVHTIPDRPPPPAMHAGGPAGSGGALGRVHSPPGGAAAALHLSPAAYHVHQLD